MMKPGTRTGVIAAMVALFIVSIVAGNILSVKHQEYEQTPDTKTPLQALGPAGRRLAAVGENGRLLPRRPV
jgi:hypothetical protein